MCNAQHFAKFVLTVLPVLFAEVDILPVAMEHVFLAYHLAENVHRVPQDFA